MSKPTNIHTNDPKGNAFGHFGTAKLPRSGRLPVFIALQPVFDCDLNTIGHEISCRGQVNVDFADDAAGAPPVNGDATALIDGVALARECIAPEAPVFLSAPTAVIADGLESFLPAQGCAVGLPPGFEPEGRLIAACRRLKEQGNLIVMEDYSGDERYDGFVAMADYVKIDAAKRDTPARVRIASRLSDNRAGILATNVTNELDYKFFRALGAGAYQGPYFKEPHFVEGVSLSPSKLVRVQLLSKLAREDYDVADVSSTLSADVSLAYRLIRFINAAAFSFSRKIETVEQAISLLGAEKLRQWLTMAMATDLETDNRGAEITLYCARRGKFFEVAAKQGMIRGHDPGFLFLFGMFSKLDALLNVPMNEVVGQLAVSDEMAEALQGKTGWAAEWLALADAIEDGDWPEVKRILKRNKLNPKLVASAFSGASKWAAAVLRIQKKPTASAEATA